VIARAMCVPVVQLARGVPLARNHARRVTDNATLRLAFVILAAIPITVINGALAARNHARDGWGRLVTMGATLKRAFVSTAALPIAVINGVLIVKNHAHRVTDNACLRQASVTHAMAVAKTLQEVWRGGALVARTHALHDAYTSLNVTSRPVLANSVLAVGLGVTARSTLT
jgi:hypothetical protein